MNDSKLPKVWWKYHHPECGTKYRGCHPTLCPKDQYERTGKWIGKSPKITPKEPKITINDVVLSDGAVMTIRKAIETLDAWIYNEGFGDDQHGINVKNGYLKQIEKIRKLMM